MNTSFMIELPMFSFIPSFPGKSEIIIDENSHVPA